MGPIGVSLTNPAGAVGFDRLSGSLGRVVVSGPDGTVLADLDLENPPGFFGVVSDAPIGSLLISGVFLNPGNRDLIFINNLRIDRIDSDGDGVPDGDDACPGTAPGAPVDASGCSGAQLVASTCPGAAACAAYKNHGAYVSCVAHAANDQVAAGLLTGAEHGAIVFAAARSDSASWPARTGAPRPR